jgi:hypothetical protein
MLKTIYDADGNAKTIEGVDAREHLETGRWFEHKPVPEAQEVPEDPKKPAQAKK